MKEHLGRHVAYLFALEIGVPDDPVPSSQIHSHAGEAVVHRHCEAIAVDAAFVAKGQRERFAQRDSDVLDSVVFVDMQVALGLDMKVYRAVFCELLKHVIIERKTG